LTDDSEFSKDKVFISRHYRTSGGDGLSGRTNCHPRTIFFDLKGNLGSFDPSGCYEREPPSSSAAAAAVPSSSIFASPVTSHPAWMGPVDVIRQPLHQVSKFQSGIGSEGYYEDHDGEEGGEYGDQHEEDIDEYAEEERSLWGRSQARHDQEYSYGHEGGGGEVEADEDGAPPAGEGEGEGEGEPLSDAEVKVWSDFLKTPLHPRSVQELPIWTSSGLFDNYFSGMANNGISTSTFEDFYDTFRFFLEECDRIECINVMADGHDGFGGFGTNMLEYIRDEVGSTVMPVWLFTDPHLEFGRGFSTTSEGRSGSLRQCGQSMTYAQYKEHASVVIPLEISDYQKSPFLPSGLSTRLCPFRTSALMASSIEIAQSGSFFNKSIDNFYLHQYADYNMKSDSSAGQWWRGVSDGGRYPIVVLEATLPFNSTFSVPLDSIAKAPSISSHHLNPFMMSFSPSLSQRFAKGKKSKATFAATPAYNSLPFSNVISARGSSIGTALENILIDKRGEDDSFRLTYYGQVQTPLPIPETYPVMLPSIGGGAESVGNPMEMNGFTAVGAGPFLEEHLQEVCSDWKSLTAPLGHAGKVIISQLESLGMEIDARHEVSEALSNMARSYSQVREL